MRLWCRVSVKAQKCRVYSLWRFRVEASSGLGSALGLGFRFVVRGLGCYAQFRAEGVRQTSFSGRTPFVASKEVQEDLRLQSAIHVCRV